MPPYPIPPLADRPRVREIAPAAFGDAILRARSEGTSFLLQSKGPLSEDSRFSFLGVNPALTLEARGRRATVASGGVRFEREGAPLAILDEILRPCARPSLGLPFPFAGGWVGFLGYGLAPTIDKMAVPRGDPLGLPDLFLALYPRIFIEDRRAKRCWEADWGLVPDAAEGFGIADPGDLAGPPPAEFSGWTSNLGREEYLRAAGRVLDYIAAGDIFQANLSRRFTADFRGDPAAAYLALADSCPEPYLAFLRGPGFAVCSASPELFLRRRGPRVETRPIKGTRPRSPDPAADAPLAAELSASPKDRAELTMIVDLMRNDLGRFSRYGSVRVEGPFRVESHPKVHHLVATIAGEAREGAGLPEILAAAFPGGSVTGAPKIRAMEILAEIETVERGAYTGALGWIGLDGDFDLSMIIRTLFLAGGRAAFHVGGGIVADSDPGREYEETLAKARTFEGLNPRAP